MIEFIQQFDPVMQAFIATLFTWAIHTSGSSLVFFTKAVNDKVVDSMHG